MREKEEDRKGGINDEAVGKREKGKIAKKNKKKRKIMNERKKS